MVVVLNKKEFGIL